MSLLAIPNELLLQIMKHLRDSRHVQALQSVARTCKDLREVAEIYLYSTAEFTTLSSLYRFLDAATHADEPSRKGYLRDLKLLYSTNHYDPYYNPPYPPDLTLFPNLESFVSESPECQPRSVKGTHWGLFKESYIQAFTQASLLNESLETPRPLQSLRSLTLHWTGTERRFWDIAPTCPIFLLPRLQSLEISCAKIGQKESADWEVEKLQDFQHKTMLKSLIFTECVVSIKALHTILSLPKALQNLTLCEMFYHRWMMGDSFAIEDTDAFNHAISQQAESLESLHIHRFSQYSRDGKTLVLSLSNFPALSNLQLGPFRQTQFKYILDTPVPPALKSLRLDEYGISMLEKDRSCKLLSGLSVEELLANSETSGLPFTLDISLQHLSPLLRRPLFNGDDVRPKIRKLINKLGGRFQELQNASTRPRLEANPEPSPACQAYSRLRILTNKPRKKIPPFLHNEPLPRFVVRYDSSHPERFLHTPYTANPIPPDRDFSSDDEDMDIAFRDNNSDLDMHTF
ncbi:uncharacterized protein F4817DRAFT_320668 [Daldinia loculata]|uniref:uncharacterized protein n=1 Tax=Daldinia loculata TaxID=103429 RepID=UPI0020C2D70C|nr:uncharacterized protein F4817DRAFT_320668 [Daldinia loculata]KAI1642552.1 hypothetical protein F4817DRAFT_320668 [Daldinia loculata]